MLGNTMLLRRRLEFNLEISEESCRPEQGSTGTCSAWGEACQVTRHTSHVTHHLQRLYELRGEDVVHGGEAFEAARVMRPKQSSSCRRRRRRHHHHHHHHHHRVISPYRRVGWFTRFRRRVIHHTLRTG